VKGAGLWRDLAGGVHFFSDCVAEFFPSLRTNEIRDELARRVVLAI